MTAAEQVLAFIATYGLQVLGAIVILVLGWIVAGWVEGFTRRILSRSDRVDETLRGFFSNLVKYLVLIFTGIAVLDQFGVQTASLIALLGAAGLAIGLALQGTLTNVAAGVMLLFFRPFRTGQYVEAGGVAGTVKAIGLFTTELATPDNVQIIVPNSQIWGTSVKNYSFHATRRVDLVLGISYADDMDKAMAAIREVVTADSRAMGNPEPQIVIGELADSSVNIIIRVWTEAGNYWPLKFALTKALKERMDRDGISIPFPQRDVHLHKVA